jgi:hypothetical protein
MVPFTCLAGLPSLTVAIMNHAALLQEAVLSEATRAVSELSQRCKPVLIAMDDWDGTLVQWMTGMGHLCKALPGAACLTAWSLKYGLIVMDGWHSLCTCA